MKVIAYCRVSTDKQDLERQRMLAADFCKLRKYDLVGEIVEKSSGTKADREGLKKLLNLTNEDCDLVVVSELSRITREEEFQVIFTRIDTLRHNGVGVCFLDDPDVIYTEDKPITLVQFIMLAVKAQGAREELLKIRDRMKSGRVAKLRANPYMVTSSQIPFGYEKYDNPDYVLGQTPKSLIRINERERLAIKFCYDMACNGKSCQKIADYLNQTGHAHNNNKGLKLWQATEVARMLRNRLYVGERTIEGVTHKVEPIVSVEVFELAGKCISQNRCIIAKEEHFNPLKGLFFCGDCGLPMSITLSSKKSLAYRCLYRTYAGRTTNRVYKPCHNNYVYSDHLVDTVFDAAVDRMKSGEYYGQSQITIKDCQRQLKNITVEVKKSMEEYNEVAADIRKVIMQLDKVTDDFLLSIIQEKHKALRAKLEEKEREFRRVSSLHTELEEKIAELRREIHIEPEMTPHQKAEFFNKVIERVEWKGEPFKRIGKITIKFRNGDVVEIDTTNK